MHLRPAEWVFFPDERVHLRHSSQPVRSNADGQSGGPDVCRRQKRTLDAERFTKIGHYEIPVGIPRAWYPPDGPGRALISASGSYLG